MKSKIQNNGHANLDSFPFRYGFTYSETTYIELINMRNKSTIVDNRYHIDADFINPSTNKEETGHFVLLMIIRILLLLSGVLVEIIEMKPVYQKH